MKQVFVTTYQEGPWELGSEIVADSYREAQYFAKRRGLGERVRGTLGRYPRPEPLRKVSEVLTDAGVAFPEKIHAACWLARLALASGVADPSEFLADTNGLIHALAHIELKLDTSKRTLPGIVRRAKAIERRIPGYSV